LLDNALKYTPRQGVVTARLTRDKATGEGVLEIEDSGPGIALQDKALALQPFHRLDNVGDQPGAGLGLALVK
ncbi:sensor histidine kinase, partial [Serratia marcescens]